MHVHPVHGKGNSHPKYTQLFNDKRYADNIKQFHNQQVSGTRRRDYIRNSLRRTQGHERVRGSTASSLGRDKPQLGSVCHG